MKPGKRVDIKDPIRTREEWLTRAIDHLRPLYIAAGSPLPETIRVSIGFPSTRGLSATKRAVGECWKPASSVDGVHSIFISPVTKTGEAALDTLCHELVHAAIEELGHGKAFRRLATAIGLEGKMTSTVAGTELRDILGNIDMSLRPFPHGALDPKQRPTKKDGVRQLKVNCGRGKCGMVMRTTKKWIEEVGLPICACGGRFVQVDVEPEDGEGGEGGE